MSVIDRFALVLAHEVLLLLVERDNYDRLQHGWLQRGRVPPQVLVLLAVVVEDVVLRHLIHLGVGVLSLPLVGVDVAFLMLAQM